MTSLDPSHSDRLAEILDQSRTWGFLGPGPLDVHVDHALGFADAHRTRRFPPPERAMDLGSGGGVPGLVLALTVWPETGWILLDAGQRRCSFLQQAVAELGLVDRVDVRRGRAEELGRDPALRGTCDLLTARSFGPPAVTAECGAPFLRQGGALVVSEPPNAEISRRWPPIGLAQVGLGPPAVVAHRGFTYATLEQTVGCPERYPRRSGVPAKRPLF